MSAISVSPLILHAPYVWQQDLRVYKILISSNVVVCVWVWVCVCVSVCVSVCLSVCLSVASSDCLVFWSLQDSEDEEGYYNIEKRPPVDEGYAESQC